MTLSRLIQFLTLVFSRFRCRAAGAALADDVPPDALKRDLTELGRVLHSMALAVDLHYLLLSTLLVA